MKQLERLAGSAILLTMLFLPLAAAHERAGLVSLLYVVSYLGLGAPAVLAGFGVVHGGGDKVGAAKFEKAHGIHQFADGKGIRIPGCHVHAIGAVG